MSLSYRCDAIVQCPDEVECKEKVTGLKWNVESDVLESPRIKDSMCTPSGIITGEFCVLN